MFDAIGDKISSVFNGLMKELYEAFITPFKDLDTINSLIFGSKSRSDLIWGTFQPGELTKAYLPTFNIMMTLAIFAFVAFIVFSGVRIASSQTIPTRRNETIESIKDLIIVGILLMNLPTVYNLLFYMNTAVVDIFSSAYKVKMDAYNVGEDAKLGDLFIGLVILGLAVWANFYYIMRKITLLVLMAMGPIMIVCIMFPRWKNVTATWFKELSGTIFVQAIHAGVFWTIAVVSSSTTDFVTSVIVYVIFIPLSEQIKRLLGMGGDMSGSLNRMASFAGLAALGAVGGAIKGARSGNVTSTNLKNNTNGGPTPSGTDRKSTLGADAGNDGGTTKNAERMLKAGDIASRAGKAVLASAGAIAGMGMGPIGSMIGSKIGDEVGGAAGVVGRGAASGAMGAKKLATAGVNKLKAGKNAFNQSMDQSSLKDVEKDLENALTEKGLKDWDENISEGVRKDLQEKFPDASSSEIDKKVANARGKYEKSLRSAASDQISNAKNISKGMGEAGKLTSATASAGAAQWAKDNRESFNANYAASNPRRESESVADYEQRRDQAFNDQVDMVKSNLTGTATKLGVGSKLISKKAMTSALSNSLSSIPGNTENMATAISGAADSIQGPNILTSNGIPNVSNLAQSLAGAATKLQGEQFVSKQVASGISNVEAQSNWAAQESSVHASNINRYTASDMTSSFNAINNRAALSTSTAKNILSASAAAASTSMMIPEMKDFVGKAGASVMTGIQTAQNTSGLVASTSAGLSAFGNSMTTVSNPIEAESKFANTVAAGVGTVFGAGAYAAARKFATQHSPYKSQVESQISTPAEAIQQAQTITDDYGNTQIAPGALRQVITPNSSHIEVMTKGGERKIISRSSAGHSGLRQGDAVYQDLKVQNDTLVPANYGATYRMDSGGARVPSSVVVNTDPNNLLGNPLRSSQHSYQPLSTPSIYNQKVDAGNFYTEDISNSGMENLSVVVTKSGQYLQGTKGNETYRLSPMFTGDTRLSSNQSLNIPVSLIDNKLTANKILSENSVSSFLGDSNETMDYYSSKSLSHLVSSKNTAHVMKMQNQKEQIDRYRRKQGIVG